MLNKEVTSKINVTDDDITAYYEQHKAEFNLIEPQYPAGANPGHHRAQSAGKVTNKAQNDAGSQTRKFR